MQNIQHRVPGGGLLAWSVICWWPGTADWRLQPL